MIEGSRCVLAREKEQVECMIIWNFRLESWIKWKVVKFLALVEHEDRTAAGGGLKCQWK
jgi:hypothetical protein